MRCPGICRWNVVAVAVLAAHAGLLSWGAWRHSPTMDEVGSMVAGISHWKLGRFDLYRVNAPLVRLVATAPLVVAGVDADLNGSASWEFGRPEYSLGGRFLRDHGIETFWWFTVARWACIPFSLLGGWYCYRWAGEIFGKDREENNWRIFTPLTLPSPRRGEGAADSYSFRGPKLAGFVALVLWCSSPSVLGHGQLITTDIAVAAAGIVAAYYFRNWLCSPTWGRALALGMVFGVAQLVKTTWIVLFGLWPVVWLAWRQLSVVGCRLPVVSCQLSVVGTGEVVGDKEPPSPRPSPGGRGRGARSREGAQLAAVFAIGLYVINLGYGFEGSFRRLGEYTFASRALAGLGSWAEHGGGGNRFQSGWLGRIPVPLPYNYVLGIDRQKADFERRKTAISAASGGHTAVGTTICTDWRSRSRSARGSCWVSVS